MEGATDARALQPARSTPEVETSRRVFISYARADAPYAYQVERSCAYWGLQTWMDQRKLGGGQNWTVALEGAIDESQALALVLTPAALDSEMVRREYLRALSRGIPVLLVRFRPVGALPAELANAQVINFQDIRTAGASLYFALADLGLARPPTNDRLDTMSTYAVMADLADRAPAEWRVYRVPMSAYWRRAFVAALPLLMALAVAAGGEFLLPRDAPAGLYMTYLLVMIASFTLATLALRPEPRLILTLARRIQQEVVILEPDGCDISSMRKEGSRFTALPTRFSYRWAASARMSVGVGGAVRVVFTDAASGRRVSASLPNGLPRRRDIARRIVADLAAFQASSGQVASVALRPLSQAALAPTTQSPVSPSESRTLYGVIAPRGYGAILASAQAWLGRRAIFPVEAIRDHEDGISLPTARGAAWSRFALFVDVPAITQSPRCQAILSDLRLRGVLLIPLRVTTQAPEPSAWSTTQLGGFLATCRS